MSMKRNLVLALGLFAGCSYQIQGREVCADGACDQLDMRTDGSASDGGLPSGPVPPVGSIDSMDITKTVDHRVGPRVYQTMVAGVTRTFVCWPYDGAAENNCRWHEPQTPSQLPTLFRTTATVAIGYDLNFYDATGIFKAVKGYNSLPWFEVSEVPLGAASVRIAGDPLVGFYLMKPPTTLVTGMMFDLRISCPKDNSGTIDSCRFQ